MNIAFKILTILLAYLLGSIPTSVWIGKIFYGTDIREHGSGNAGSTNTIRVLGLKAGLPVLIIDILKGVLAVNLIYIIHYYIPSSNDFVNFQLLLGAAAVLGHIFPIYARFKGGKGVATLCGIVLAIYPDPALITIGVFALVFILTHYVSLSSIIAGFTYPIIVIIVFKTTITSLVIFSLIISVLLLLTHQKNIERLLKREESKVHFSKRKRKYNKAA